MKIAVIGYSGSGKSTLADILGEKYAIPVLHLDKVNFLPGWQVRDLEECKKIAFEFMQRPDWIIDGNYGKLFRKERLEEADKIILLKFNRFACLARAYRRYKENKGSVRSSMADGCFEKFDFEFIKWILHDGRTRKIRKEYKNILRLYGRKTVVINNQKQLDAFIKDC